MIVPGSHLVTVALIVGHGTALSTKIATISVVTVSVVLSTPQAEPTAPQAIVGTYSGPEQAERNAGRHHLTVMIACGTVWS
jgi:hypothetical protein